MTCGEVAFRQQLLVCQQCRRARDVQIFCKPPRRRQARAGNEHSIEDCAADSAIHLLLQPFARARINPNQEASGGWVRAMAVHKALHIPRPERRLVPWLAVVSSTKPCNVVRDRGGRCELRTIPNVVLQPCDVLVRYESWRAPHVTGRQLNSRVRYHSSMAVTNS